MNDATQTPDTETIAGGNPKRKKALTTLAIVVVLAALGWAADESHHAIFDAHADWAQQALDAALNDAAPLPEPPEPAAPPELDAAAEALSGAQSDAADPIA